MEFTKEQVPVEPGNAGCASGTQRGQGGGGRGPQAGLPHGGQELHGGAGLGGMAAHPVDDIHHQLDRAAAEGLPEGDADARGDARRGIRPPAHGKTAMDKSSYRRQVPRIDLDKVLFPDEESPLRAARRGFNE